MNTIRRTNRAGILAGEAKRNQVRGSNFLSMLPQSQTAPRRFREPNKWNASRPISPVLLKVFSRSEATKSRLKKGLLLALFLIPLNLFAWTDGELLIWMDADRGQALKAIAAKKFENDFGLKVTIEAPEKITDSFPIGVNPTLVSPAAK